MLLENRKSSILFQKQLRPFYFRHVPHFLSYCEQHSETGEVKGNKSPATPVRALSGRPWAPLAAWDCYHVGISAPPPPLLRAELVQQITCAS